MYTTQIGFDNAFTTKDKNLTGKLNCQKSINTFTILIPQEIGKTWEDIQSQDDGEMRQQSDSGR